MPAIRFADRESATFFDLATPDMSDTDRERVRRHEVLVRHPGASDELQMWELTMAAGVTVPIHAHETSEIAYVLQGELRFGSRLCGVGTSVLVPANTLYSFKVGAEGCRFLLFRERLDESYISKEQFRDMRTQSRAASPAGVDSVEVASVGVET